MNEQHSMAAFIRALFSDPSYRSVLDYINNVKNPTARQTMKKRLQEYQFKQEVIEGFETLSDKFYITVFAAEWNADCWNLLSALAKLLIVLRNDNISTKVVDFDENRDIAEELGVLRVPTMIVFDKSWRELGRFIIKPQLGATIEEELLAIIKRGKGLRSKLPASWPLTEGL